jgi:hypothetical protein
MGFPLLQFAIFLVCELLSIVQELAVFEALVIFELLLLRAGKLASLFDCRLKHLFVFSVEADVLHALSGRVDFGWMGLILNWHVFILLLFCFKIN